MKPLPPIATAVALLALRSLGQPAISTTPPSGTVTFTRDIAPILFNNCVVCHRPGNSGPFSLLTYANATKYVLPVDVSVMAISPHAHYLADDIQAYAVLPDGTRQALLHIPHWNFYRQEEYRYTEPVPLPKGTTVVMDYVYDNSADNPQNPSNPPKRVRYGLQTKDEMAEFMMQVLTSNPADRNQLYTDFNRHVREQNAASITHWARLEPNDLSYRAAYARLCAGEGRAEEAEQHFRFVLDRDPKQNEVRFSYANLLVQARRYPEATAQCKAIVETAPDFLQAHNLMGLIALNLRRYSEAEAHFRRCVSIEPDYRVPLGNLGQALASQGKLDEAEQYFREMLRLDPDDARAIKYLNQIAKHRLKKENGAAQTPRSPAGK
jgi:tetratricopeptide (TPR) repeat protein